MGTDQETDGLCLTAEAKQAGAIAFGRAMGKGTFDTLADEALFPEMAELWDCATVKELKERVATVDRTAGVVNTLLLSRARAEYLAAAMVVMGIHQQTHKKGRKK